MPNMQILHSNTHWGELINEFVDTYEEKYTIQKQWVEEMQERRMTLDEAYHVAERALQLRHYDERIDNEAVDPLELLLVKRREDKGDNAWLRYNVMQEHLVAGEYKKYGNDGMVRKAKVLTNIDELIRMNTQLSDLFSEVM